MVLLLCSAVLLVDTSKPDWPIVHANSGCCLLICQLLLMLCLLLQCCAAGGHLEANRLADGMSYVWTHSAFAQYHLRAAVRRGTFLWLLLVLKPWAKTAACCCLQCCAAGGHLQARLANRPRQQRLLMLSCSLLLMLLLLCSAAAGGHLQARLANRSRQQRLLVAHLLTAVDASPALQCCAAGGHL
jgi:hypothetical protein